MHPNIYPISKEIEFVSSEGLKPRGELIAMGNKAVEGAPKGEKGIWSRALDLALSFYDRFSGA